MNEEDYLNSLLQSVENLQENAQQEPEVPEEAMKDTIGNEAVTDAEQSEDEEVLTNAAMPSKEELLAELAEADEDDEPEESGDTDFLGADLMDDEEETAEAVTDDITAENETDAKLELSEQDKELLGTDDLDAVPDNSDIELNQSELERLDKMNLDEIVGDINAETASVEDLFRDVADTPTTQADTAAKDTDEELNSEEEEALGDVIGADTESDESEALSDLFRDAEEEDEEDEESDNPDADMTSAKKPKKSILEIIKGIFFVQKKEEEELPPAEDENQQVLQDLYGADENGELLDTEEPELPKGFFARMKAKREIRRARIAEEDRLEEEAEALEAETKKKTKDAKKAAAAEKKTAAKEAKKAKPKKEKKPKPVKEKKEKKPKPPTDPRDILKIKPKAILMLVLFVAGVVVLLQIGNNIFSYNLSVSNAKLNLQNDNYQKAYEQIHGMDLNKADENMGKQLELIMQVQRSYDSYVNYQRMNMPVEALDALIKGLIQYDSNIEEASQLGVGEKLTTIRGTILDALQNTYKVGEQQAATYQKLFYEDFTRYYRTIETYGGVK